MAGIAWVILALYTLPLLGILFSLVVSEGFARESPAVYVVGSITEEFLQTLRDTFGSLMVPLLTAFAVKSVGADERVPRRTMAIFLALAALFVVSVVSVGLVKFYQEGITRHDPKVYEAFQSVTRAYAKEFLTYIALTIGISLRRG